MQFLAKKKKAYLITPTIDCVVKDDTGRIVQTCPADIQTMVTAYNYDCTFTVSDESAILTGPFDFRP